MRLWDALKRAFVDCRRCDSITERYVENDNVRMINLPEVTGTVVRVGTHTMRGQYLIYWTMDDQPIDFDWCHLCEIARTTA